MAMFFLSTICGAVTFTLFFIISRDVRKIDEQLKEEKKRIDYLYKEINKIKE